MRDRLPTIFSTLVNTAAVICIVAIVAMFIPSADRVIEEFRSAGTRPIPTPQVAAAPVVVTDAR